MQGSHHPLSSIIVQPGLGQRLFFLQENETHGKETFLIKGFPFHTYPSKNLKRIEYGTPYSLVFGKNLQL
jgi:hypothetical protein